MSRFADQILDQYGRPVPGVSIYVYVWDQSALTAGVLETLTDDLSAPLSNPLTSDATGEFYFNAANGQKLLEYRFGGVTRERDIVTVGPIPSGPPGGDGALFGLFTEAATKTAGTASLLASSGYSAVDKGAAVYVYDVAVNSAYVTANPRSSFITADARGFRLSLEQDITPEMFGAPDSVSESSAVITALNALMLSKSFQGTGSVWPFQDLFYDRVEYGRDDFPISPNAGAANFTTPFFRGMYLGANHIGGGQTGFFMLHVNGAPNISSANFNYTPLQTAGAVSVNLGGTGLTTVTAKGAIFGHSCIAIAYPGATNLLNVTGGEIDIQVNAGASVAIKTGLQIAQIAGDAVSGTLVDAGLAFSNAAGAIGWNMVVCLSHPDNGQHPVKSTGTLIGTIGSPSCAKGLDLSGVTFSGNAIATPGWTVGPTGAAASVVSIGYATGAGGTVTQLTSKATGVALNKICGAITLNAAALAANTIVSFVLTNSAIGPDDDVRVWVKSGNASVGSYRVAAEGNASGSRTIVVENKTAGSLSEAIVLGVNILKAVAA